MRVASLIGLLAVFVSAVSLAQRPLFDTHLHDNAVDAQAPGTILEILARNGIERAVVTSIPPERVLALYRLAPGRIVPLLGVYRSPAEKAHWHADPDLPNRVAASLAAGPWRGIGELHLFAGQRHSPVFRRLVELAVAHDQVLLLHADPAVIDAVFELAPQARVIWAHAGAYPYPPLLEDYLDRYPGLYIDLSMREARIAPDGRLDPAWETLLIERADRFLVGVDTFSAARWREYDRIAGQIRAWLEQLPADVAQAIASGNARRLFP